MNVRFINTALISSSLFLKRTTDNFVWYGPKRTYMVLLVNKEFIDKQIVIRSS